MESGLEAFTHLVRKDPLFAAEGMHLERGEANLLAIEDSVRELDEVCSRESFAARLFFIRYPTAQHALPLGFVRTFIESERARRRFLAYPSASAAQELLKAWRSAAGAYASAVTRYRRLHTLVRRLDPESGAPVTDMFGGISVLEDTEKLLQAFEANAAQLQEEVHRRSALLAGNMKLEDMPVVPRMPLQHFIPGEVPAAYKHLLPLELEHRLPFRVGTILETYGPLTYTLVQFDGKPVPHQFMFYVVRNNATGVVSCKLSSLDTYLFLKLGEGARPSHAGKMHVPLVKMGMSYWYQPSTNLYTARDQTYWADIATIVDMARRPELSEQVAVQRSSLFDLLLGACWDDHQLMHLSNAKALVREGGKMPKKWYSLVYRTHPSIYFLPFNGSVWRMEQSAPFMGSQRERPGDPLYVSADVVLKATTPEEFELIMKGGRIREEARNKDEKEASGA